MNIEEVENHLAHLIDYAIEYSGRSRRNIVKDVTGNRKSVILIPLKQLRLLLPHNGSM